jgi:hypothetical protein
LICEESGREGRAGREDYVYLYIDDAAGRGVKGGRSLCKDDAAGRIRSATFLLTWEGRK